MKIFIRIAAILTALILLSGAAVYFYLEPIVERKIRQELEKVELPEPWELSVSEVQYKPFNTVTLSGLVLSHAEEESNKIKVKRVDLSADILKVLRDKELTGDANIRSLEYQDLFLNAFLSFTFDAAETHKEALDPSRLKKVIIDRAFLRYKDLSAENITGEIFLEELDFTGAEIDFVHKEQKGVLEAKRDTDKNNLFLMSLAYPSVSVDMSLEITDDALIFEKIRANVFDISAELSAEVKGLSQEMPKSAMRGSIKADLGKVKRLFEKSDIPEEESLKGALRSDIEISASGFDAEDIHAKTTTVLTDMEFGKLKIERINITGELAEGVLDLYDINAVIYEGVLQGNMNASIFSPEVKFDTNIKLAELRIGKALNALIEKETNVTGKLDGNVSLKGSAVDPGSFTGKGSLHAYDANLGPMPILAPLIGNLYTIIRRTLPVAEEITIEEAYSDFTISDEKLKTDHLIFAGQHIFIEGSGTVGFDGTLDLLFESELTDMEEPTTTDTWQRALRGAMISFGKAISRARLRGTIQDPKWEFQYLKPLTDALDEGLRRLLDIF